MLDLLLHLVVIGIATAIEPVQLIGYVGVLSSGKGVRAGWGFLGGWVASLLVVSGLTFVAAARVSAYASSVVERRGVRRGLRARKKEPQALNPPSGLLETADSKSYFSFRDLCSI